MTGELRRKHVIVSALTLLSLTTTVALAEGPPAENVNGTLTEIDGLSVLRVWGTPHERGYAQGYLLGDKIVRLIDAFLADGILAQSAEQYEQQLLPALGRMKTDAEFESEVRGLLAGIEARAGGSAEVPFLGRALRYDDLLAVTCTGDLKRGGCSSFAAWGEMTEDSHTIGGRNMDWPEVPVMVETQMILVNVPIADSGKLGWVAVTWPAYLGCVTAMNAEGVTVATHDAEGRPASVRDGFTPYGLMFRRALESAHAATALEDVAQVLRSGISLVGNNMMVTRPYSGDGPGAVVFEFDGNLSEGQGVTLRLPEEKAESIICTNHFRLRAPPNEGDRYIRLDGVLQRIEKKREKRHLTVKRAWKMLQSVSFRTILTHHSTVFEPNKGLMHVALAKPGRNAPKCKKVTLDVQQLLAGDYPGGK
jgi:hypothetical protein